MPQFWYDDTTAGTVAQEAKAAVAAAGGGRVACLACPSLFRELKKSHPDVDAHLFEYDDRFAVLGNFSYYDYKYPEIIPDDLLHSFTVVVADPPYLVSALP